MCKSRNTLILVLFPYESDCPAIYYAGLASNCAALSEALYSYLIAIIYQPLGANKDDIDYAYLNLKTGSAILEIVNVTAFSFFL